MKRILVVIIIFAAAASLPFLLPSAAADETWTLHTGLNFAPGLVYNRSWDPGYSGSALTIMLTRQSGNLIIGAGAEAGYSYTGLNLLFPLQAGLNLAGSEKLNLTAFAVLLPGLILSRPSPYFLFSAELAARLSWAVTPGFSLSLSAGPRYTISPQYSTLVAPLELIDLTIGFAAGFRMGN